MAWTRHPLTLPGIPRAVLFLAGCPLLTHDTRRYETCFANLTLIAPDR